MRPRFTLVLLVHAVFALAATAQQQPELVVSSGFVESKRISSGDPFLIWISFENRSDKQVRGLRFVDFHIAGLVRSGECWKPFNSKAPKGPHYPACLVDSPQPNKATKLPDRLAPGQAITVTASLKRGTRSGELMVAGVYSWAGIDGRVHRALIPIGPIEVTTHWDHMWTRFREDVPLFLRDIGFPVLKDLALPIAAFILGFLIRIGEQKRSALQQTWHQMLPQVHEHTMKYYLPVLGAAEQLIKSLESKARRDPDEPFYFLALLFRRWRAMIDAIGGVYFKDRLGEDITLDTWNLFFDLFTQSFPNDEGSYRKEILVDSIAERETLREYKKKLSSHTGYGFPYPGRDELAKVQDGFKTWEATDPDFQELVLPLLRILYGTILYEINRPYGSWYTEPAAFDTKTFQARENELKAWLDKAEPEPKAKAKAKAKSKSEKDRVGEVRPIYENLARYRRRETKRLWGTGWAFRLGYRLRYLRSSN